MFLSVFFIPNIFFKRKLSIINDPIVSLPLLLTDSTSISSKLKDPRLYLSLTVNHTESGKRTHKSQVVVVQAFLILAPGKEKQRTL